MITVRVSIECIETGETQNTEATHANGYAAWANAANEAWEAFGRPASFGFEYRVASGDVVAQTGPLGAFPGKVVVR